MLIHRLSLMNIYQFAGQHYVDLAADDDSNITLIVGRNSAGKTSLIRALRFLFYGLSRDEQVRCVNKEMIRLAKKGKRIAVTVECNLSIQGQYFTLMRTLQALKEDATTVENARQMRVENIRIVDEELSMVRHCDERDIPTDDPRHVQYWINERLPESMFDFFFFKGEELAHRLIEMEDEDMQEGLATLLYKHQWGLAQKTIASVIKNIRGRIKETTGAESEFEEAREASIEVARQQDEVKRALELGGKQVDKLEKQQRHLDQAIEEEIGRHDANAKAQLKELKGYRDETKKDIAEYDSQRAACIGGSHGPLLYMGSALKDAKKVLKSLQKQKLLPAEISEDFLAKIIKGKECICGAELTSGSKALKQIKIFRDTCLSNQVNHRLSTINGKVQPESEVGYPKKTEGLRCKLREWRDSLKKKHSKLAEIEAKVATMESAQVDCREDIIRKLRNDREDVRIQLRQSLKQVHQLENESKKLAHRLSEIREKLDKHHNVPAKLKRLLIEERVCESLKGHVESIEKSLQKSFYRSLKESTSEVYEGIVVDKSKVYIDPISLLPKVTQAGASVAAGGGQTQTLVLAYLMALAELRKDVNKQIKKHFAVRKVDDQCFFMDSIFAPMEDAYRGSVSKALPGKMKQLVLILSPEQWKEQVPVGFEGHISRAYSLVMHSDKHESNEAKVVDFYGKKVTLTKACSKDVIPYTAIKEIK